MAGFAKIVLVGDSGAGKTTLLHAMLNIDTVPEMTIGCAFRQKRILVPSGELALHFWDTAGQERFRSLTHAYARGARVIILVVDATSDILPQITSWHKILKMPVDKKWKAEASKEEQNGSTRSATDALRLSSSLSEFSEAAVILLVINKVDKADNVDQLRERFETPNTFFTSALSREGLSQLYDHVVETASKKCRPCVSNTICIATSALTTDKKTPCCM